MFDVRGTKVAVIASTQINDYTVHTYPATDTKPGIAGNLDNTRLLAAVRAARAAYDVVVVYLHWGSDYTTCPDGAQTTTAAALAKAGADVVVGGHAHRVQGAGWLGRTYVDYGLGNFVWLNTRGPGRRGQRGPHGHRRPGQGQRPEGNRPVGRHRRGVDAPAHRGRRGAAPTGCRRGGEPAGGVGAGPVVRPSRASP